MCLLEFVECILKLLNHVKQVLSTNIETNNLGCYTHTYKVTAEAYIRNGLDACFNLTTLK